MKTIIRISAALLALFLIAGCERPPIDSVQRGYRGTGMVEHDNPRLMPAKMAANALPAVIPGTPAVDGMPTAGKTFKNVQVLGDLSVAEFTRTMLAITSWVAPNEGCNYCHKAGDEMSADTLYTKVVARKMLKMTKQVNADWSNHVGTTGVTCYTCHRGQSVPANVWFDSGNNNVKGMLGNKAGQNAPAPMVGYTSLPNDPLTPLLEHGDEIKVISTTALPAGSDRTIKQTEQTYGLMMHISDSLGVNCTFCHNTRSFASWDTSTPQRATAWYGIRMVRDLNKNYLDDIASTLPANRHGPLGDGPKLDCATCHQGAYKPLYGTSILKDYPELNKIQLHPPVVPEVAAPAAPAAAAKKTAQAEMIAPNKNLRAGL